MERIDGVIGRMLTRHTVIAAGGRYEVYVLALGCGGYAGFCDAPRTVSGGTTLRDCLDDMHRRLAAGADCAPPARQAELFTGRRSHVR